MYGQDFWERVSWAQVCEFLRYGHPMYDEKGTLEERAKAYDKVLIQSLHEYQKNVVSADWSQLTPEEEYLLAEDLYQNVLLACARGESISFEAGFLAGMQLGREPLG